LLEKKSESWADLGRNQDEKFIDWFQELNPVYRIGVQRANYTTPQVLNFYYKENMFLQNQTYQTFLDYETQ
jgi:hypothetical protein